MSRLPVQSAACLVVKTKPGNTLAITLHRQQGVALVVAIVILLILTILGITAMSTSSLQEKMSGNIQEQTRAFQAAESGLTTAFTATGVFDVAVETTKPYIFGNTNAEVKTKYRQTTPPLRGSGYSISNCNALNFDQISTGYTGTIANPRSKTVIQRGVGQIVCN
jgi:type II secretory pathway pseudopilin PulG